MRRKISVLLAGAMFMMAGSAYATPVLTISDGIAADTVTVDANASGLASFAGTIGAWTINVSSGLSPAGNGTPNMDLSSLNKTGTSSAGTLTINFTDTITSPWDGNGAVASVGGTLQGNNSAVFNTIINGTTYSNQSFTAPPLGFSGSQEFAFMPTGSDTIDLQAILTNAANTSTSFDYNLTPVPEPGTMVLLGFGMLGLAIYGKRRMNKEA